MSSDNLLKKEFTQKDVNRLRNIYKGKSDEATMTQVGYTRKNVDYKEGDVWTEGNTQWTIKGGIKQTYTQLDGIKKLLNTPLMCPECNRRMRDKLDKRMYQLYKKCFGCIQSFETKLRIEGKYEEYAKDIMFNNARTFATEAGEYLEEIVKENHTIFTESGKVEDWSGPTQNKLAIEKMKEELSELKEKIK